jgi:tetratricopeptide (TPR) repeat protein
VAAGELIDTDPETALAHAEVARRLASRIAVVREAVGLAAYHAGQWQTAIAELRAYHRMSGRMTHLAVLADCERALGRPERAIDIFRAAEKEKLAPEEAVELLIVAAGARGDLGQHEAAVSMLQVRELTTEQPWSARLRYAYADALLSLGRTDEAREWFARAAEFDEEGATDAAERLLELDGVVLDDESDEDVEDESEGADDSHADVDDDEDDDEDDDFDDEDDESEDADDDDDDLDDEDDDDDFDDEEDDDADDDDEDDDFDDDDDDDADDDDDDLDDEEGEDLGNGEDDDAYADEDSDEGQDGEHEPAKDSQS